MRAIDLDCRARDGRLDFIIEGDGLAARSSTYVEASEPLAAGDCGFPLALITSMVTGGDVLYEQPCSRLLIQNGEIIARLFREWFPRFAAPRCSFPTIRTESPPARTNRVGAFFTGGVDSFFSLLENQDEITDLVYVHGFDVKLDNLRFRKTVSSEVRAIAEHYGKTLIEVESDLKTYLTRRLRFHWRYSHGTALAVVLHALSQRLDKIYIASSHYYPDDVKWGSHPHLDRHWSSENIQVVHHGYWTGRVGKVHSIARDPFAIRRLRVCFENPGNKYNCGDCEKCLRTLTAMRIAGCIEQAASFAGVFDVEKLKRVDRFDPDLTDYYDQYSRAVDEASDPELSRVLREISQSPTRLEQALRVLTANKHAKRMKRFARSLRA